MAGWGGADAPKGGSMVSSRPCGGIIDERHTRNLRLRLRDEHMKFGNLSLTGARNGAEWNGRARNSKSLCTGLETGK